VLLGKTRKEVGEAQWRRGRSQTQVQFQAKSHRGNSQSDLAWDLYHVNYTSKLAQPQERKLSFHIATLISCWLKDVPGKDGNHQIWVIYSVYKNKCRIFKPVEITIKRGLR
jgi:hypothetical protein